MVIGEIFYSKLLKITIECFSTINSTANISFEFNVPFMYHNMYIGCKVTNKTSNLYTNCTRYGNLKQIPGSISFDTLHDMVLELAWEIQYLLELFGFTVDWLKFQMFDCIWIQIGNFKSMSKEGACYCKKYWGTHICDVKIIRCGFKSVHKIHCTYMCSSVV